MKSKLPEGWKEVRLSDVIQFNPRESIKKATIAKKIGMDKLTPFQKKIEGFELAEYKSGTKFRNGDTLLARITPCLENGKTAQVTILDQDEIGFGSTEFIVLREKNDLSINNFIYYLSLSPMIKDVAIKSMTGTSGRQRAQRDVIEDNMIIFPAIKEQKVIADTLSSLDNKIELNNKINKNLEQQAQEIFKHWFVDFEFPDENGKPYKSNGGEMVESELGVIPEGWEVKNLGNIIKICNGKRPPVKVDKKSIDFRYPILGAGGIMGYTNQFIYDEPLLVIGRVGTHGVVQKPNGKVWTSDNTMVIKSDYYEFVNITLLHIDYKSLNRGSTQPLLAQKDIKNQEIIFPDKEIIESFENIVGKFNEKINMNKKQNQVLSQLRDTLLPKLMNGEIRIPLD